MTAIIVPMDKIRAGRQLAMRAAATRDIGLRVAAARIAAGMSQADLCKMAGLASSMVSQWERGKHRPSLDQIAPLLPLLEVSLDYLFLGETRGLSWEKSVSLSNAWEEALEEEALYKADVQARAAKSG
jgi:transcriptional regulator with XRE-family HTH domain